MTFAELMKICIINIILTYRTYVRTICVEGEHMYEITQPMSLDKKLEILSDAAKYDVACTSSGVDRRGEKGSLGNSCSAGICHAFAADGRCISLLKILMTNHCIYDCKYCKNRKSNDIERTAFTPEEICNLTIEFYKRNYIEGLFLSSGIINSPDYTMEKICEALRMLRTKYHFNGYIHVKAIPGASSELIYSAGLLADRISLNMELPTQESLKKLAPNKSMSNIIKPMNQISEMIVSSRLSNGKSARMERSGINKHLVNSIFGPETDKKLINNRMSNSYSVSKGNEKLLGDWSYDREKTFDYLSNGHSFMFPADIRDKSLNRPFAAAGQSTQMIIGATDETDFDIIRTTQSLYQGFDLKRVFFSGYIPINEEEGLPSLDTPVPLVREHRLYQADWLLRFYGFKADELLSDEKPFFDMRIDPKCDWAIRNLDKFPVEINTASYETLLKVPGIGPKGVKSIMSARRYGSVSFEMLKKMHIVLKRAQYFITCNGKMLYRIPFEQKFITNQIADIDRVELAHLGGKEMQYRQMDLFSDFKLA